MNHTTLLTIGNDSRSNNTERSGRNFCTLYTAIRYNPTATERPTIDIEKSTTDFRFQAEIKE